MEDEFNDYLDEYRNNLASANKDEKLKLIKKYIKHLNFDNLQEKNIIDYILDEIDPFINEECTLYPVT